MLMYLILQVDNIPAENLLIYESIIPARIKGKQHIVKQCLKLYFPTKMWCLEE